MKRRALVTGAGRGIGEACAVELARSGCDITCVARTRSDLDDTARQIRALGRRGDVVPGDVTDDRTLAEAFAQAPVDLLVNAAGTNHPEPFTEVPLKRFDELVALNLRATFAACQLAARGWIADGREGVIVNVSSQMGHVGARHRSVYCATKHAVEGLTKALAVELGPLDIRVVSVAPTFIATPMTADALADPDQRTEIVDQIPLGFVGEPRDVAHAVVFAASERARLLHGASLIIDGGWTAR